MLAKHGFSLVPERLNARAVLRPRTTTVPTTPTLLGKPTTPCFIKNVLSCPSSPISASPSFPPPPHTHITISIITNPSKAISFPTRSPGQASAPTSKTVLYLKPARDLFYSQAPRPQRSHTSVLSKVSIDFSRNWRKKSHVGRPTPPPPPPPLLSSYHCSALPLSHLLLAGVAGTPRRRAHFWSFSRQPAPARKKFGIADCNYKNPRKQTSAPSALGYRVRTGARSRNAPLSRCFES